MNKVKLLEITFKKLAHDRAFMAYYLQQYSAGHHKEAAELMRLLDCNEEAYYRLGLCKAPETSAADFNERLARIAAYAGVNHPALLKIMVPAPRKQPAPGRIIHLPQWLRTQGLGAGIAASLILCFTLLSAHQGKAGPLAKYMPAYTSYTDSIKFLQPADKTGVFQNHL